MGNLENIKIVCTDFEMSAEAKENILIVFRNLLDEVPYDAFMKVTLSKIDTGISGKLHVSSVAGEFISHQQEMTPQSVVHNLYEDMHAQLIDWKSRRFSEPPASNIA
ncbi:MAG: hypothetical protein JNL11_17145 [Bdellovibrionaceae bacterium]|nr:hypothetical protein [Pseudobdellovibrionaceae bacterium]